MYGANHAAILPMTGMAMSFWYPIAGVVLIVAGLALMRGLGTLRRR